MFIIYLLLFSNSNKRLTRHLVYDNLYNDIHSYPYSYITVNPSLVVPDYSRIDEKIGEVIGSLATTDISKIGKSHSAIIMTPKPMSADTR